MDLSLTATGWADTHGTGRITVASTGVDRLWELRDEIHDIIAAAQHRFPDLAVIEGYAYGRPNQAAQLGELGGVVRLLLRDADVPCAVVPPSSLKLYATGKGNASKDLVRDCARDRLGLPAGVSSDECDAAWLRAMGLDHLGHPVVAVAARQRAALDKIDWPDRTDP